MPSAVLTVGAACVQVVANTAQGILGVYWNDSNLSVYGLLLYILFFLFCGCALLCLTFALVYRDFSFFQVADHWDDIKFCGRNRNGKRPLLQVMMLVALVNFSGAVLSWFSTPPSRTPPIIQALSQALPILTAIPCSKWLVGDKKNYFEKAPLFAIFCVIGAILMSLIPSIVDGSGFSSFKGKNSQPIAWSFIYLLSTIPAGVAMPCQQVYLIRAGAADPGASRLTKMKAVLRLLFYNQVFIVLFTVSSFWMDLIPWFGSTTNTTDLYEGIRYSFQCSMLGPAGVSDSGSGSASTYCVQNTPLYGFGFIFAYLLLIISVTTLNIDSAVFNTVCYVLNTMAASVFWIIPGTNPSSTSATPPLWSVIIAVILSAVGVTTFKVWEMKQPPASHFEPLQEEPLDALEKVLDPHREFSLPLMGELHIGAPVSIQ